MRALLANRRSSHIEFSHPLGIDAIFVSSDASVLGDGSFYNPFQLQIALNNAIPGKTFWLRGGVYEGTFTTPSNIHGTSNNPIAIRSYPEEWAIIDSNSSEGPPFTVNGDYWILRDLEITNSSTDRSRVLDISVPYNSEWRSVGLLWNGDHGSHINLLIHDNGSGIAWFSQAAGGLSYGNIVWNNGWAGSSNMRGHGHGWYCQNDHINNTPKTIKNCISTNSGGSTCRTGGQNSKNDDFLIESCTFANSAAPCAMTDLFPDTYRMQNLDHGSGEFGTENLTLSKIRTYEINGSYGAGLSTNWSNVPASTGLQMHNNYISSGAVDGVLLSKGWSDVNISGNIVHGGGNGPGNETLGRNSYIFPTGTWNNNQYFSTDAPYHFNFHGSSGWKNFSEWRAETGFDTNSTYEPDTYPPDMVYVEPNDYEVGRSYVTVYNWTNNTSVELDLSTTGLVSGEAYYVFNAMNPLGGSVASGVYDGSTINVSMDPNDIGGPATPVGDLPAGPQVSPIFACFIIRKVDTMRKALI